MISRRALAGAALVVALLASCSDTKSVERAAATSKVQPIAASAVPAQLLGLVVSPEEVKDVADIHRSYVESSSLFGLRQGDELMATLQLSKFNKGAAPESAAFRTRILAKVGGSVARPVRMGNETVYFTSAAKQLLAVWFKDRTMFILSCREDYPTPRTLVRAALDIEAP